MEYIPFIFLILSVGLLALAVFLFFNNKVASRVPLCFGIYMLSLITMCAICYFGTESPELEPCDGFFSSIISAFAALGVQAPYDEIAGRLGELGYGFKLYSELLFISAPLVSGTVVISIVSGFLPYLKFSIKKHFCREILVFSDLNKQSVEIFENIAADHKNNSSGFMSSSYCALFVKPGEPDNDLSERVAKLNGIVVNKSVDEVCTHGFSTGRIIVRYYFVRDDDMLNVEDCLKVTSEHNWNKWCKCRSAYMYIYAQSDEMPSVVEQICDIKGQCVKRSETERSEKAKALQDKTHFAVIPYVTNTIYKTLSDHPLYEVLDKPSVKEPLTVVICGTDIWAEEIFRAVYWCGQLPNKELRICCICEDEDSTEQFRSRIYHLIPELDVDTDPLYCSVEWCSAFVGTQEFDDLLSKKEYIRKARVWFIGHGSDEENTEAASYVRSRLDELNRMEPKKTVIHYMVRNSSIQAVFNKKTDDSNFVMHAFASLRDRHIAGSLENELYDIAFLLDDAWSGAADQKNTESEYNRRSSLAQALYVKYLLYSVGLLEKYNGDWKEALKNYLYDLPCDPGSRNRRGYWEHRRWNAFMRSIGYRYIDADEWMEYQSRGSKTPLFISRKDTYKRLHTCIAEYPEKLPSYGPISGIDDPVNDSRLKKALKTGEMDTLDKISYYSILYGKRQKGYDIKSYDYSMYEDCSEYYLIVSVLENVLSEKNGHKRPGIFVPVDEFVKKESDYNDLIKKMSESKILRARGYLHECKEFLKENPYQSFCKPDNEKMTVKTLVKKIAETRNK